jgi:very-short-patch-repair endonuclease
VSGLITATVAPAVVASWPLLVGPDQRGPAITAVRTRLITSAALAAELAHHPRLAGRRELSSLIGLLEAGCESELEIWGHVHVFDVPGLRHAVRQKVVRANGKMYRLDHAYEDERLAVEMDGMRFHSSREQRERDMRRDADLATIAWQTLRLSHHRLHHDVLGCRRDTLATLAARRR